MNKTKTIKKWYKKVTISLSTGTEGPQYDPYSYSEYAIYVKKLWRRAYKIVVHLSLSEWLSDSRRENKKGKEQAGENSNMKRKKRVPDSAFLRGDYKAIAKYVKNHTTYSLDQIEEYMYQSEWYCKICKKVKQCGDVKSQSGFPGEHFILCKKCHTILESEFHESEII